MRKKQCGGTAGAYGDSRLGRHCGMENTRCHYILHGFDSAMQFSPRAADYLHMSASPTSHLQLALFGMIRPSYSLSSPPTTYKYNRATASWRLTFFRSHPLARTVRFSINSLKCSFTSPVRNSSVCVSTKRDTTQPRAETD